MGRTVSHWFAWQRDRRGYQVLKKQRYDKAGPNLKILILPVVEEFFGFLQFDDGIKLDAEGNVTKINNKPFEADKIYKTLWPISMRNNTEPKATNDPLLRYLNATIKKKKPHHECTCK